MAHIVENAAAAQPALGNAAEKYMAEVGWRDFATALLDAHPDLATRPLRPEFGRFPWRNDESGFRAWAHGRTGYPIVDAGMRQLWRTGYLPNRARLIAASFLVQHLLIDKIYSEYDDDDRFPEIDTDILGPLEALDLPTDMKVESVTMYGFRNASTVFIMTFLKAHPSTIRSFQLESLSMNPLDMSPILDEMMLKSVGSGLQDLTIDVGRDRGKTAYPTLNTV